MKDKLKGGLADKAPDSKFNPKSVTQGMKVEQEHTSDKHLQKEISKDHLTEDSKYYDKLSKMEKKSFWNGFEKRASDIASLFGPSTKPAIDDMQADSYPENTPVANIKGRAMIDPVEASQGYTSPTEAFRGY